MKRPALLLTTLAILSACAPKTPLPTAPSAALQAASTPGIEAKRDTVSKLMGDSPNFAQTSNGRFSAVVSRDFGRGAKAGALIEFFYPHYARDHLYDAFNGIYYRGKLYWFHELELVQQTLIEDTGIIVSEFRTRDGQLRLSTQDVALRDSDSLMRHVEITNTAGAPVTDLQLFFYEFFTVNYVGAGDSLTFDATTGSLNHSGNQVHFTIGSAQPPQQWQVGGAGNLITNAYDARLDANDGKLRGNGSAKGGIGLGVNGTLGHRVPALAPGQTFSMDYFISAGRTPQQSQGAFLNARRLSWAQAQQQERAYWQQFLARGKKPNTPDERVQRVYRRALITMKQNTAENGAVMAAPTLFSPVYAFSWPRDGSVTAEAYLEAGYPEEARKFIEFMAGQQKPNGGWAVNFFMDGSRPLWDFGDRMNEHDQVGTMVWIIHTYFKHTRDVNWLRSMWPTVQRANDFLLRFTTASGLIGPCRDLWELHTDKSWAFSNAAAYAGLSKGADIAEQLGDTNSALRWRMAATKMKQAMQEQLWLPEGYYARGVNPDNGQLDKSVETANLGLHYPFEVLEAQDPRMVSMADTIYRTLTSPRRAVKRYTNDRYYDGNPWPATTDWLAIYYQRQGNTARAQELHSAITNYAFETRSLMLGEQFDEERKLWVSAFPLTWSESKYILGSLEIFR
jgi:glucoamylase